MRHDFHIPELGTHLISRSDDGDSFAIQLEAEGEWLTVGLSAERLNGILRDAFDVLYGDKRVATFVP